MSAATRWGDNAAQYLLAVEAVGRGVGLAGLSVGAAFLGRCASVGFRATDVVDVGELARAAVGCGLNQQPRHRVGIWRWLRGDGFAFYFAAVGQLPCRAGEVGADDCSLRIEKFGVGRFECPLSVCAGVDLHRHPCFEQQFVSSGRQVNWG